MSHLPAPHVISPLPDAVERIAASVIGITLRRGRAAGVVWQPGVVVTCASAVWRQPRPTLMLPGGETVEGQLRGVDIGTDLAAISYAGPALTTVARDAEAQPRAGDFVFATGRDASGGVMASFGHVGSAGGEWRSWRGGRIERLVRLDGGLYPGLDGAPVAHAGGVCIGIASSAFSRHHGVALPPETVDRVLAALLTHGRLPQAYLGVATQPVRAQLDGQAVSGLLVSSVAENSPAARAGLLVGDVIVQADGRPVDRIQALRELLGAERVGTRLALQVARGGQALALVLDIGERPGPACH